MKLAACVLILNDLNQVVLTTRRNSSEVGLPGGKVDYGETSRQAAIRETKEETGIILDDEKLSECFSKLCEGEVDFITTCFIIKYNGEIPGGDEIGINSFWGDLNELVLNSPFKDYNLEMLESLSLETC